MPSLASSRSPAALLALPFGTLGVSLGLASPSSLSSSSISDTDAAMDDPRNDQTLVLGHALSRLIGWAYFFAWSFSFWPQLLLNAKRKRVDGLSLDFLTLNVIGFLCYTAFNATFLYSPTVRRQYRDRHGGNDNQVQLNDLAFAFHALLVSAFTLVQAFWYRRNTDRAGGRPSERLSKLTGLTICVITLLVLVTTVSAAKFSSSSSSDRPGGVEWIDVVYLLSYVKLYITLVKYIPQARLNFRRRSTVGWSIHNILLDFTGGVLSVGQLLLDAALADDWGAVRGDAAKIGLAVFSISFDLLFILQHYVLFRHSGERERTGGKRRTLHHATGHVEDTAADFPDLDSDSASASASASAPASVEEGERQRLLS